MAKLYRFILFLIVNSLFLTIFSSPVAADIFWSTPAKINNSNMEAATPATITGPNGYLHVVWQEIDPAYIQTPYWTQTANPGIYYAYWNGDAWSTPIKIYENTGFAGFPSITVTSDNKIHVVWEDDSRGWQMGSIFYSTSINYGASWSAPVNITAPLETNAGASSWYPRMVKDAANNLHVSFIYSDDSIGGSRAYYSKLNGTWSTPVNIDNQYVGMMDTAIAVDSSNNPHVVMWGDGENSSGVHAPGLYYTAFSGSWSTPTLITSATSAHAYPRMIIDGNNIRHVVWFAPSGSNLAFNVEYIKSNGGSWTAPITITSNADFSFWQFPIMGLTLDSSNNIYVGWGERVNDISTPYGPKGVNVSYKKWNGSSWSDPFFMRYVYDLDTPFIYNDKWDNQHLAWVEENSTSHVWELWFATIPTNVKSYTGSSFSMTLGTTNDTLTIPSGALASSATISAQIGPLPASANPAYTTLPRSYTFRPHGLTFATKKEATAVINYTDAEIIGADERNMKVYIWDGTTNSWSTSFTTSINAAQNKATVTLPHFSLFGIMLSRVTWLPPLVPPQGEEIIAPVKEGTTLPIKFTLTFNGLTPAPSPEDVSVEVTNADNVVKKTFGYGTDGQSLRFDQSSGQYIANLKTNDLGESGVYKINVYMQYENKKVPMRTIDFSILPTQAPGQLKK